MACEYTCDHCGKKAPGDPSQRSGGVLDHYWPPRGWKCCWIGVEMGVTKTVPLVACCKECMEELESKTDLELLAL